MPVVPWLRTIESAAKEVVVLMEMGLVEQRYKAVLEVLEGAASVTDVARRYGVGRQAVHTWLRGTPPRDYRG